MKKLLIFLTDSIQTFYKKGELKKNYYNPGNLFDEVAMISFVNKDIEAQTVSFIAGRASLRIISVGRIGMLSFFTVIHKIFNLISKIKPDAIRAYDPSLRGFLAVVFGKIFKIPVMISLHADLDEQRVYNYRILFTLRKILERFSISLTEKVICVTEHVASYAKRYGAKSPLVIYNRVDFGQFNPKKRNPIPKLILSVGRLNPQKYHSCLIRAVKDIDVKLILIGQGPQSRMLKALALEMGLSGRIEFIDFIPHGEIYKYYAIAEIFAIATHYEGFCIPVLEAMASGVPVVASDIAPIREISRGAAKLVKNTPESFRDAFLKILGNNKKISEMSSNGIKIANEIFDYHKLEELEKTAYVTLE